MAITIPRPVRRPVARQRVAPSVVDPATAAPFTLAQELRRFGKWVGAPIWAPPKNASRAMAETMLDRTRPFTPKATRWGAVEKIHRDEFTQVREIELVRPSIRLPQGRFFVTVAEQRDFDQITDAIPDCVQTRLDEFLAGPGRQPGVKVYYLKPLCVEVGDELILTDRADVMAAVAKIQEEVFAEYRRLALYRRPLNAALGVVNAVLAAPRSVVKYAVERRQRAIDAYQAHLELKRRRTALDAARAYRKCRTDGCTFDEMLELTSPLKRTDVIEQYCVEEELSRFKRQQLLRMAAGTVPWFVALSVTASLASSIATMLATPSVLACDPAFVAEMPDNPGVLLKIGHFDEVAGVTHVEI